LNINTNIILMTHSGYFYNKLVDDKKPSWDYAHELGGCSSRFFTAKNHNKYQLITY